MEMWTVVNAVYFNDGTGEIFGYQIASEDKRVRKIISAKIANNLKFTGELRFSPHQELAFCSVDRGYKEVFDV